MSEIITDIDLDENKIKVGTKLKMTKSESWNPDLLFNVGDEVYFIGYNDVGFSFLSNEKVEDVSSHKHHNPQECAEHEKVTVDYAWGGQEFEVIGD